jgi:hypothetical protein
VEQNLKVAVKILLKTMDSATPSPERIELSTLRRTEDGHMVHYTLSDAEVRGGVYCVRFGVEHAVCGACVFLGTLLAEHRWCVRL